MRYPIFTTPADVKGLTEAQARAVIDFARDRVQSILVSAPSHALDDEGDYLAAAIDNYHYLFHCYWDNDGAYVFVEEIRDWLMRSPDTWGGSDGEIRFELCPFAAV